MSWRALIALGEIGDERAIEPLVGALKDQNEYNRFKAALLLVRIGDPRAMVPLIHRTLTQKHVFAVRSGKGIGTIRGCPRNRAYAQLYAVMRKLYKNT